MDIVSPTPSLKKPGRQDAHSTISQPLNMLGRQFVHVVCCCCALLVWVPLAQRGHVVIPDTSPK